VHFELCNYSRLQDDDVRSVKTDTTTTTTTVTSTGNIEKHNNSLTENSLQKENCSDISIGKLENI